MRSIALTLVSTLLLSPIAVLSTPHTEEHDFHHIKDASHLKYQEEDYKYYEPKYAGHSDKHDIESKNDKFIKIAVEVDFHTIEEKKCRESKKLCHGDHGCEKKINCHKYFSCKAPKKSCHRGHRCTEEYKKCGSPDLSDYGFRCGKKFFSHSQILEYAGYACSELKLDKQKSKFPALYTASDYWLSGPYFEWPFYRTTSFFNIRRNNKHRVIITKRCEVVGAVIRNKKDKSYSQCKYEKK